MQNSERLTRQQISDFLKASEEIIFSGENQAEVYAWVERVLVAQEFKRQSKKDRGAIRTYVEKVTGLSTPQVTRLIRKYKSTGQVRLRAFRRRRFARQYTEGDVALLAEVDRAHERLSGPATVCKKFGKAEFRRLAGISVSHLYNLRRSAGYRKRAAVFEPTRPTPVSIAERRKPDPQGQPGFLRVDTVHQGDWDGAKGVYHINAVDSVTQWQVVGCASKISEQFLIPVLEAILHQFPFRILGFHADNGSEFINHTVAKLLEKLRVEFTKSRTCRSQDQALVEGKNGAVIRKLIGYGHIASEHSEELQKFYMAHFNPYLNYHRPCGYATVTVDARGKRRRSYPVAGYATPLRQVSFAAPGESAPQARSHLQADGCVGRCDERHRVRRKDEHGEGQTLAPLQKRVTDPAALSVKPHQGCGNAGPVESVENQKPVSHTSHRPLEISPTPRDFHIPTAATTTTRSKNPKTKKGSRPLRGLPIPNFHDHLVLETNLRFMIILGLENAPAARTIRWTGPV